MTGSDSAAAPAAHGPELVELLDAARERIAQIADELGPDEIVVLLSTAEGLLRHVRVPHLGGPVSLAHERRGPR